jgi:hypothetical protein
MPSDVLSVIDPSREETWRDKVFLTVDIDWVDDDVLAHTLDLLRARSLKCTFFATHESSLIRGICADAQYEVGIHPNYNDLLDGMRRDAPQPSSFEALRAAFPGARCVRSHSLVQSSRLQNDFARHGLTHDSNNYIPFDAGLKLKPWTIWNGLVKVPFVWADDIHLYRDTGRVDARRLKRAELCVLAFHPIHLYLNSDSVDTYESHKAARAAGRPALESVNRGRRGVADLFDELMNSLL